MTYTKTALVADDSAEVRRAHREALQSLGFLVIEAEDGFRLLDRLRKVRASLVLADLELRGLDGTEVLHFIRRNEDWMDIPVVVTSALTDASARRLVRQCGGTAFLGKPVAPETLKSVVGALLLPDGSRKDGESSDSGWKEARNVPTAGGPG
jgi:CheY-like chemotaxis protein